MKPSDDQRILFRDFIAYTHYFFQNDNISCPTFKYSTMTEETMYLEQYRDNSSYMIKLSDTLCYYEISTFSEDQEAWLLEKRLKNDFWITKYIHWKIVDLGRMVVVSAVDITDNADASSSCNTDLGMSDLSVTDDQISASSYLPEFPPYMSRPYYSGWCPQFNDEQPFIQIEMPFKTTIEGITVYNSREAVCIGKTKSITLSQIALAVYFAEDVKRSFIYYHTFIVDTSLPDSHPQTFWFQERLQAMLVKVVIQKGDLSEMTCIRIELHGCRHAETFQTINAFVRKRQINYHEVVGFTSEIDEFESILTSIGFPGHYSTSQSYNWIIRYPEFHFIKLVFTHIELNTLKGTDHTFFTCNDSIIISNDLADSDFARVIDSRYNGVKHSLTVETKETQIVVSFVTCAISSPTNLGNGFRTFATFENMPACFSLRPNIPWHEGLRETCNQLTMLISSMSYLGFSFSQTSEQWTIHIPNKRVHVEILNFHVPCQNENYPLEFKIIENGQSVSYCNINRPPDSFYSSSEKLTIYFLKGFVTPMYKNVVASVEGFRIIYSTVHDSEEHLVDYKDAFFKVRNIALDKPAVSRNVHVDRPAVLATDGITFQDWSSGLCFGSDSTWWLLDLQNVYNVYYIVLYNPIGTNNEFQCGAMVILSGLAAFNMQRTAYLCDEIETGRTIRLHKIVARYIQLQLIECVVKDLASLSLCEVQVYGELEMGYAEPTRKEPFFPTKAF
ncbi:uncharacterized protein LOC123553557 [Mercenaria mercenaria]|uniref:uncharacterized protein LOC123553557 n=1 Tax=Mercenaria mercenaria TaxID=6596 RepID=UPI00234EB019|nr:uncharacterized protein LOC123553557 [Mercenaria mercenaria]